MAPELEGWVLDELDEGDEEPPGVWPIDNQSFQQHPCNLLLDGFSVGFSKEMEKCATEVVGVAVGVSQLVGNGVQEQIATWCEEAKGLISY